MVKEKTSSGHTQRAETGELEKQGLKRDSEINKEIVDKHTQGFKKEKEEEEEEEDAEDVKSEKDSMITHESGDIINSSKLVKNANNLFPIFDQTFEKKADGNDRICIRCLKSKPDRCHHCSICNTCILMMDHH
jgi:hypothetical protein